MSHDRREKGNLLFAESSFTGSGTWPATLTVGPVKYRYSPSHSPSLQPHYWPRTGAWDAPFHRDDELVCNFGCTNFSSVER